MKNNRHCPENAALAVEAAGLLLRSFPDENRVRQLEQLKLPAPTEPLISNDVALLAQYIELNRNALVKVGRAVQLPSSRYTIDMAAGLAADFGPIKAVKSLSRLTEYQGFVAIADGRPSEGVHSVETQLGLAKSLESAPLLIPQLVRIACLRMACETAERLLCNGLVDHEALTNLASRFAEADRPGMMARALVSERACAIPLFYMNLDRVFALASRDLGSDSNGPSSKGTFAWLLQAAGYSDRDLNFYLGEMETNIAFERLPPPQCLALKRFQDSQTNAMIANHHFVSAALLPALSRLPEKEATALAYVRAARVALSIVLYEETNGSLPDKLADLPIQLADPYDGHPLRYARKEGGRFIVYSIGPDLHDDKGKEMPEPAAHGEWGNYDLVFAVRR